MAAIPTISEIYANLSNDLRNKLDISDDNLKKVLDAVALSLSGQLKLLYLAIADVQNNIFPDTADAGENGGTLDRQGIMYLNRIRRPSTSGNFIVSVNAETGSSLRKNITFKSNDDSFNPGNLYVLDQEQTLVGPTDEIEIRSLEGGSKVLLEIGDTLTITEPVIGVEQIATVVSVSQQPFDEESLDDFRAAILQSIQLEPQGGAKTDYRLWAADAQGVKTAYPFVKEAEAGTVQVYIEATKADSLDGLGSPSQAILDEVAEVIELDPDISLALSERGRRPIQANVEVLSIALNPIDITISGLQNNTQEIRDSIFQNLESYLEGIRPYVAGADLARNKDDILYSARMQAVVTDVLSASNFFTDFKMFVSGVEQLSYLFSRNNIPYLRNITIT